MEWTNWSGSLRFKPGFIIKALHQRHVVDAVHESIVSGQHVRVIGAGHSSSPLVETDQLMLNLSHMTGVQRYDPDARTVTFHSGTLVKDANHQLQAMGLALFNTGDVDVQMLAGAIATGTHGSGRKLQNLSSMLDGVTLVDGEAKLKSFNEKDHPAMMRALRVGLGSMGIFTTLTVKVVETFSLERVELWTSTNVCLEQFTDLASTYRNVDFYWYPRRDEVKLRILDHPGVIDRAFTFKHYCDTSEQGPVADILPRDRQLKFDEMEYAVDASVGLECFNKIRARILQRHRKDVAWRVLVRTVAADDNYLSPHYGRDSMTISLHHNAGLPYNEYFNDIEPIFLEYGGRPHWGKKHSLDSSRLRGSYPGWDEFMKLRQEIDPNNMFMNQYLHKLFGNEKKGS